MHPLELVCRFCQARFESGVPLQRDHLEGVKLQALEVCPACGAIADYRKEDYLDAQPSPRPDRAPARGPAAKA